MRVCVRGADGTHCLLVAAASSGRTGASAKRLWRPAHCLKDAGGLAVSSFPHSQSLHWSSVE